jgi:hypothetical protein
MAQDITGLSWPFPEPWLLWQRAPTEKVVQDPHTAS